eukprot:TRINITY_DN154_c0_g1_i3.p1 TRINITY_DN154_c0_g1~~TRINITY_DN154_c0_g1_i3.p1  ORF type:complete len:386 (-),score=82.40 TRINITY_DN154_c0_g1_i3:29-1132(-)
MGDDRDINRLAISITAHSWNADRTRVAVCPNNNEVHIYQRGSDGEYLLEHSLIEHDAIVTGIDWGHKKNRILTCAQDRNAYVWRFEDGKWKPTLVILRLNRAATRCRWSPKEDKFAVASGAKLVSICYFESDNDWWVSKHIKKHRSTVLDIDWHPNNVLIATACSDFKTRVFSAFVRGVDQKADVKGGTAFGSKLPFGALLKEIDGLSGWVHTVKWSPSGQKLGFSTHDSTLYVLFAQSADHKLVSLKYSGLPFRDFIWVSENSLVAVGHDCSPVLFSVEGETIKLVQNLDQKQKKGEGNLGARDKFKNLADRGSSQAGEGPDLDTKHQNCIVNINPLSSGPKITQFSTTGLDGQIAIWDLSKTNFA